MAVKSFVPCSQLMTILVTGATGFIGRHLVAALRERNHAIVVLTRTPDEARRLWAEGTVTLHHGDMEAGATLAGVCQGVDSVFHLASYAHADNVDDGEVQERYWRITVDGTRLLLAEAARAGVRHFIFLSSVKAMGEVSVTRLDETAECHPISFYGRAKLEAEKLVLEADAPGLRTTILRLPMVYGPGCKGNLPRMIRAIDRGLFPPWPAIDNKRSMVDVRDVVQAALLVAANAAASGKIYIVTDGETYSTRQIYAEICAALGHPVPKWTIPLMVLRLMARLGDIVRRLRGRRFVIDSESLEKLTDSAWYSSERIRRELGYQPSHTLRTALTEMVAEFRKNS